MTPEAELALVLGVLEQRGVEVRVEACDSDGGLVRVKEHHVLFLNQSSPVFRRLDVALAALRRLGAEGHYLPPHLRARLEREDWSE